MEQTSTSTESTELKHHAPWGVFIGLLLILAIIVTGAYYSFTKRYAPSNHMTPAAQHSQR